MMILGTKRTYLREIRIDDFIDLCKILRDIDVMYAWEHAFSTEEVLSWIDENILRYDRDGYSYWAVIEKSSDRLIGVSGVIKEEAEGENYTGIGYIFNKDYWGKGYAIEVASACVRYAFAVLGVEEITAQIRPKNASSIRIAEKLGMSMKLGFVRTYKGKDMIHALYGLTEENYYAND